MIYTNVEHFDRNGRKINETQQVNEFFGLFSLMMAGMFSKMFDKLFNDGKESGKDTSGKDTSGKDTSGKDTSKGADDPLSPANIFAIVSKGTGPNGEDEENEYNMFLDSMFDKDGNELSLEQAAENMKENFKKEDGSFDEESFNSFKEKQTNAYNKAKESGDWDKVSSQLKSISPEDREKALEDAKKKSIAIHKSEEIQKEGDKALEDIEAERQQKITEATEKAGGELANEAKTLGEETQAIEDEEESIRNEEQRLTELYSHSGDEARALAKSNLDSKNEEIDAKLTDEAIEARKQVKVDKIKEDALTARDTIIGPAEEEKNRLQKEMDDPDKGPKQELTKAENALNTFKSLPKEEKERLKAEDPNYEENLKANLTTAKKRVKDKQSEIDAQNKKISTANNDYDKAINNAKVEAQKEVEKENNELKKQKIAAEKQYTKEITDIKKGDQTDDPKKIQKRIDAELKERRDALKARKNQHTKDLDAHSKKAEKDPNLAKALSDINNTYDNKAKEQQKATKEKVESTRKEAGLKPEPPKNPNNKQAVAQQEVTTTPKSGEGETNTQKQGGGDSDEEMKEKYKQILKDAGKSDEEIERAMNDIGDEKGDDLEAAIDAHAEENNIDIDDLDSAEEEEGDEEEDDGKGGKVKTKFRKVKKKVGKGTKIQRWSPKSNEWRPATKEEYQEWKSRQGKKNESIYNTVKCLLLEGKIKNNFNKMKHLRESIATHTRVKADGYGRTSYSSILEPDEVEEFKKMLEQDLVLSYSGLYLDYADYSDSELVRKKVFGPQLAKVYKDLKSVSGIYLPQGTELKFKGQTKSAWALVAYKYYIPSLDIDIIMPIREGLFVSDFARAAGLIK